MNKTYYLLIVFCLVGVCALMLFHKSLQTKVVDNYDGFIIESEPNIQFQYINIPKGKNSLVTYGTVGGIYPPDSYENFKIVVYAEVSRKGEDENLINLQRQETREKSQAQSWILTDHTDNEAATFYQYIATSKIDKHGNWKVGAKIDGYYIHSISAYLIPI